MQFDSKPKAAALLTGESYIYILAVHSERHNWRSVAPLSRQNVSYALFQMIFREKKDVLFSFVSFSFVPFSEEKGTEKDFWKKLRFFTEKLFARQFKFNVMAD